VILPYDPCVTTSRNDKTRGQFYAYDPSEWKFGSNDERAAFTTSEIDECIVFKVGYEGESAAQTAWLAAGINGDMGVGFSPGAKQPRRQCAIG
jgi:hypothetical protein